MKYYQEISVIRSITAILVVSVHVIAGLYYAGGEFTNTSIGYINQLARIGTPIFAIISAFLLMSMVLRKGFDLRQFIQSRFSKIFVPYLIWSSVYLLYKYHVENSLNPDLSISSYFLLRQCTLSPVLHFDGSPVLSGLSAAGPLQEKQWFVRCARRIDDHQLPLVDVRQCHDGCGMDQPFR